MANQSIIAAKAQHVEEIQALVAAAQSVVLVDYRGYTVEEDTRLRNAFRAAGVNYAVIKNSIMERACEAAGIDAAVNEYFKGPTAVAFGIEDAVAPAKVIKEFIRTSKKGVVKGGIVNGKVQDPAGIDALAELPPREVLIARILGSINAPITKLAIAINAIKEKLEGGATEATEATEAAAE